EASREDRSVGRGARFFSQSLRSMSVARRRAMIEPAHQRLSIAAQCRLLSISRSSYYYAPVPESEETLALMRVIDAAFLDMPWYGSRQMVRHLRRGGYDVGRRRVRRLMGKMGLSPIYQRPRTSDPHPQHRIYPYLLRKLEIVRPNHVWCADVTYIPMRRGFLYLVAVMDWATRKVLAWRLSNTMDAGFCVAALAPPMVGRRASPSLGAGGGCSTGSVVVLSPSRPIAGGFWVAAMAAVLARLGIGLVCVSTQGSLFTWLGSASVLGGAVVWMCMDW